MRRSAAVARSRAGRRDLRRPRAPCYTARPHGRLTQWESASFTRKKSQVRTLQRPLKKPRTSGASRFVRLAESAPCGGDGDSTSGHSAGGTCSAIVAPNGDVYQALFSGFARVRPGERPCPKHCARQPRRGRRPDPPQRQGVVACVSAALTPTWERLTTAVTVDVPLPHRTVTPLLLKRPRRGVWDQPPVGDGLTGSRSRT